MSNPRYLAILNWQWAPEEGRAAWFRGMATAHFHNQNGYPLTLAGLPHPGVYEYQTNAIDRFLAHAANDDEAAADYAATLIVSGSGADRGLIADNVLWHRAFGPRVRATFLKRTMCKGRSGSVLVLHASSIGTVVDYFRETKAEFLMSEAELGELNNLPDTVEVYRGAKLKPGPIRRTAYAMSWTQDYRVATWFANKGHGGGEGVVLKAEIPRAAILASWSQSGAESEIVVEPRRLRKIEIVERVQPAALAA